MTKYKSCAIYKNVKKDYVLNNNLFIFLIAEKKPIRKPDPNLRQLQRQISFGSGAPLIGLGSLKKKQMSTGKLILNCLTMDREKKVF